MAIANPPTLTIGGDNQPKTLSGIETQRTAIEVTARICDNQPKTLSGIETRAIHLISFRVDGDNQPKTLSGIETWSEFKPETLIQSRQPAQNPIRD